MQGKVRHRCRPRSQDFSGAPVGEVETHSLVHTIGWQIFARIPRQSSIELSDILQAGHVGLLHAVRCYRPETAVPFASYARHRIRGEILDMLRRLDGAPRSVRRWQRALEEQTRELSTRLHRAPTEEEISEGLGLGISQFRYRKHAIWSATHCTLPPPQSASETSRNDDCQAAPDSMPDVIQERNEYSQMLLKAIVALPPREQRVVVLYYRKNFTMKEIGVVLRVKESRVSQIHKTALQSMSRNLRSSGITSARDL